MAGEGPARSSASFDMGTDSPECGFARGPRTHRVLGRVVGSHALCFVGQLRGTFPIPPLIFPGDPCTSPS